MRESIRTTLIGGVVFLIPLVMAVVVIGKAFQILKVVATPVDKLIPIESVAGVALVEVLTVAIMLLCCLLAGLIARGSWGRNVAAKLDSVLLHLVPDSVADRLLVQWPLREICGTRLCTVVHCQALGPLSAISGAPSPRSESMQLQKVVMTPKTSYAPGPRIGAR